MWRDTERSTWHGRRCAIRSLTSATKCCMVLSSLTWLSFPTSLSLSSLLTDSCLTTLPNNNSHHHFFISSLNQTPKPVTTQTCVLVKIFVFFFFGEIIGSSVIICWLPFCFFSSVIRQCAQKNKKNE